MGFDAVLVGLVTGMCHIIQQHEMMFCPVVANALSGPGNHGEWNRPGGRPVNSDGREGKRD